MAKVKIKAECCENEEKTQSDGCCSSEKKSKKTECSCGGPSKEITKFRTFCGEKRMMMKTGEVTFAPAGLCWRDLLGDFIVRFGFMRMNYAVKPGLYAVGKPDRESPVLLSANYKMSFDALRKELGGINVWILVLDTKGVNVWCAAGKGTFGTDEVIRQIKAASLDKLVTHRNVISPQLGASGIAAHTVRKQAGFKIIYGPVEACDIKMFLKAGLNADEKQRTVVFGLKKRIEVTGVEFMTAVKIILAASAAAVVAASFTGNGFSLAQGVKNSVYFIEALFLSSLSATVIPAALLPVLPGRMFSVKGAITGLITSVLFVMLNGHITVLTQLSTVLLCTTLSSFVFMNYTGTTTFTSLTGVRKEIAVSVPIMIITALIGVIIQIVDFVIKGGVKWN
jgi:hypothetical protein